MLVKHRRKNPYTSGLSDLLNMLKGTGNLKCRIGNGGIKYVFGVSQKHLTIVWGGGGLLFCGTLGNDKMCLRHLLELTAVGH